MRIIKDDALFERRFFYPNVTTVKLFVCCNQAENTLNCKTVITFIKGN